MSGKGMAVPPHDRLAEPSTSGPPAGGPTNGDPARGAAPFRREELSTPDGRRLLLYWGGGGRTDGSGDGGAEL
jgi:hypothetical protein